MIFPLEPDRYPGPPEPDGRERYADLRDLPAESAPAEAVPPGMVPTMHQQGYVTRVGLLTDSDGQPSGLDVEVSPEMTIVRSVPRGSIRHERLAAEALVSATGQEGKQ